MALAVIKKQKLDPDRISIPRYLMQRNVPYPNWMVLRRGVVMGTEENKEILAHMNWIQPEWKAAKSDIFVIVVRAADDETALGAIGRWDELLTRKKIDVDQEYRPRHGQRSGNAAGSRWVWISVAVVLLPMLPVRRWTWASLLSVQW